VAVTLAAAVLLPCLAAVSCGDVIAEVAEPWAEPASSSDAGAEASAPAAVSYCANKIYACGDLADNDSDGLVDWQDPDCLGPCDDTEDTFYSGQPGIDCRLDCFWDDDSGWGNDGCYWDHRCDELAVPPDYPPEGGECSYDATLPECDEAAQQSQQCRSFCLPLTPNGCDCFGCCTPPGGSPVWLGSTDESDESKVGSCDSGSLYDESQCKPCTPAEDCKNDCGHCELCFAKTELPADCLEVDGGTGGQCPPAEQPCGLPFQPPCPDGSYCITGCCQPVPK